MRKSLKYLALPALALSLVASSAAFAESAGQYIDDAAITTKVKGAILGDPQLKVTQVSVTTDHGAVQLTGAVDTKEQESKAVNLAKQVGGVKSVQDNLTVRGTQSE